MNMLPRRSLFSFIPSAAILACCSEHISIDNFHGAGSSTGTTLEYINLPTHTNGYSQLSTHPGLAVVVRKELATRTRTSTTPTPLFSFVQMSDTHLMDVESPLRADFLEGVRAQELLTKHGLIAMINRIRSLRNSPHTGRQLDCVISTGDQTDNHELIELDWFFSILNGGTFIPKSGDPHHIEAIQNWGGTTTWQPDNPIIDDFKKQGFPYLPGFISAICQPIHSNGLNIPWYSVFGNHDSGAFGDLASVDDYTHVLTGKYKVNTAKHIPAHKSYTELISMFAPFAEAVKNPNSQAYKSYAAQYDIRTITPDPRRAPFDRHQYIKAHLDPHNQGPGPIGHGYTQEALDSDKTWSSVILGQSVKCLLMDSCSHFGSGYNGSIGERQLKDLEKELRSINSHYYDSTGKLVRHNVTDQLCMVFSHHTSTTMDNIKHDPAHPEEKRYSGDELVAFLQRFPTVIAWINGHEHHNKITPQAGTTSDRSFWEINTASHIDFPHHSRIIEVADNHDGTLSIFTTLIESDAPTVPTSQELTLSNLGSLYREIAANTHAPWEKRNYLALFGDPVDHNTELIIKNPLA